MKTNLWFADDPWAMPDFSKLAQAMVAPLMNRMDYSSIARKCFLVQQLPEGMIPMYNKDNTTRSHISKQ